jgi:acyl-CoA synthetase (AMP-forming)/AMP-acid ligase II
MILRPSAALAKAVSAGAGARVLAGSGVVKPFSPVVLARLGRAVVDWGLGPAGGFTMLAARYPDRVGIVDELGEMTYGELHRRTNVLARALAARGVGEGDGVAVMCRNHRGFVEATVAIAKLGADSLYLNTAFAGPQLVDVLAREKPRVVIHDEEFTGLLAGAEIPQRILAWTDSPTGERDNRDTPDTVDALASLGDASDLRAPSRHGRIVILTSGTTGTPKGAPRTEAGIDAAISLLSRMPLREGWRTHIAAPLFHTWGFAHLMLAMLLGSTMVLRRRFDPVDALRVTEGCDSLVVIPVMLQRMLAAGGSHDLSRLKVVASSGSALPGDLALEWMNSYGDNLYNIYGSTEVAYASIATPEDLRTAPTSAGKPPWGTVVKILDEAGRELPPGEPGRIFVGNSLLFDGYTGGGGKEIVDGLMSSGDVGRFDADGRLYVEGRDDEMIVSGGENVFPKEVEDCLARHPAVVEVACVGVDDTEFGKRLRAFAVIADEVSEDTLKGWVKDHLARFKVPREIIVLPELPRNATGKVLKRELASWEEAR